MYRTNPKVVCPQLATNEDAIFDMQAPKGTTWHRCKTPPRDYDTNIFGIFDETNSLIIHWFFEKYPYSLKDITYRSEAFVGMTTEKCNQMFDFLQQEGKIIGDAKSTFFTYKEIAQNAINYARRSNLQYINHRWDNVFGIAYLLYKHGRAPHDLRKKIVAQSETFAKKNKNMAPEYTFVILPNKKYCKIFTENEWKEYNVRQGLRDMHGISPDTCIHAMRLTPFKPPHEKHPVRNRGVLGDGTIFPPRMILENNMKLLFDKFETSVADKQTKKYCEEAKTEANNLVEYKTYIFIIYPCT